MRNKRLMAFTIFLFSLFQNITETQIFILYIAVSASPLSGSFPLFWFPVQSLLFTPKSLLCTPTSRANLDSTYGTACGAQLGGGGGGPLGGVEASLALYVFLIGRAV